MAKDRLPSAFDWREGQPEPTAVAAMLAQALSFHERGQLERAEPLYRQILAWFPDHYDALHMCGVLEGQRNNAEAAVDLIKRAIAVNPNDAGAHSNLGNALRRLNRWQEALVSYDRALALKPDFQDAFYNRGNVLRSLMRYEDAVISYEQALRLAPGHVQAHFNRGNALQELGRHREALASYDRALTLNPNHEYGMGRALHARLNCCEWMDYEKRIARVVEGVRAGRRADYPFSFLTISDSAADQLQCARIFVAHQCPAAPQSVWRGEKYRHDRIRLAYLSADFQAHPASFLLAGMFENHDRSRFETIAISFGKDDRSEIRGRMEKAFERFIDVSDQSDVDVARLLRELEVDIAVDLMGHTRSARLGILPWRPAPIQVNFFCPGTSGAEYLDYIICDRVVIPEEHHACYAEKVVYLPDTFQANDSKRRIAEHTPSRTEAGLPEEGFVFCSFNNAYKFTPGMFDIWMRLLGRIDGSVLWLQAINDIASNNLRQEALRRGISANRLIFAPRVPRLEDHLARYRLADLFLDTLPYNAQSTASDALWAGLPVITCLGTTFVGRVAASLLHAIGLPELIAHSLPEYEALALQLAADPARLADLRARLARNRGTFPLFDTDRFRRHIESAYIAMWERQQRGDRPASFAVPAIA